MSCAERNTRSAADSTVADTVAETLAETFDTVATMPGCSGAGAGADAAGVVAAAGTRTGGSPSACTASGIIGNSVANPMAVVARKNTRHLQALPVCMVSHVCFVICRG